jgi:hypothetical protein
MPPVHPYTVIDLMPAFWRFWEAARNQSTPARIRLFRRVVIEPHQRLYAQVVRDLGEERLGTYLGGLPSRASCRGTGAGSPKPSPTCQEGTRRYISCHH